MTVETKDFDPAVLGAFTTGVLMTEFSPVHEAAEWLMGHPIWTHEFPRLSDKMKAAALAQYPDLPTEVAEGWEATRDAIRARYGETVSVVQGDETRTVDPLMTARQALNGDA